LAELTDKNSGLKADTKAISFQELLVTTISTGSVRRSGVSEIEVVQATPASLHTQLHDSLVDDDIEVIKIGAWIVCPND